MKKIKLNVLILLTATLIFFLCGCKKNDTVAERTDYSEYSFTDTSWTREAEHDVETIRFGSDGSYAYWCACGNPVNDSDLNEGYTYDDATKTIKIKYVETTKETVPSIKIEECNNESIKLNFDGEIREFVKEEN